MTHCVQVLNDLLDNNVDRDHLNSSINTIVSTQSQSQSGEYDENRSIELQLDLCFKKLKSIKRDFETPDISKAIEFYFATQTLITAISAKIDLGGKIFLTKLSTDACLSIASKFDSLSQKKAKDFYLISADQFTVAIKRRIVGDESLFTTFARTAHNTGCLFAPIPRFSDLKNASFSSFAGRKRTERIVSSSQLEKPNSRRTVVKNEHSVTKTANLQLKHLMKTSKPVSLKELVTDSSFGKTVEKLFALSILMNQERIRIDSEKQDLLFKPDVEMSEKETDSNEYSSSDEDQSDEERPRKKKKADSKDSAAIIMDYRTFQKSFKE